MNEQSSERFPVNINDRVLYWPTADERHALSGEALTGQPLAGTIVKCNPDGTVNLCVQTDYGDPRSKCNIPLIIAGPRPETSCCTPYELPGGVIANLQSVVSHLANRVSQLEKIAVAKDPTVADKVLDSRMANPSGSPPVRPASDVAKDEAIAAHAAAGPASPAAKAPPEAPSAEDLPL